MDYPDDFYLKGYQPTTTPNPLQINRLMDALELAERPVVLTGAVFNLPKRLVS